MTGRDETIEALSTFTIFHVYIIVDTVDIDKDGFTETLLWDERYDMLFVRSAVSSREAKDVQKLMDHGFQT